MKNQTQDTGDLSDLKATVAALATLVVDLAATVNTLAPDQVDRLLQESATDLKKLRRRLGDDPALKGPAEIAYRRAELLRLAIRPQEAEAVR